MVLYNQIPGILDDDRSAVEPPHQRLISSLTLHPKELQHKQIQQRELALEIKNGNTKMTLTNWVTFDDTVIDCEPGLNPPKSNRNSSVFEWEEIFRRESE
eukprot:25837_1